MNPKILISSFSELTTIQLYNILQLRNDVFIVEQNCPYLDIDSQDQESIHLWVQNGEGKITAYLRILPKTEDRARVIIGRVVVHSDFRQHGFAKKLLQEAFLWIQKSWGDEPIEISAQSYLLKFYGSLGFEAISDVYLEDNIEHLDMLKTEY